MKHPSSIIAMLSVVMAGCASVSQEKWGVISAEHVPYHFDQPPFIHPRILHDLTTWISDIGDQVVAINLTDARGSNRYFGDVHIERTPEKTPRIYYEEGSERFTYQYIGQTRDGFHAVRVIESGSGSGVFSSILLLQFIHAPLWENKASSNAWEQDSTRILLYKVGEIVDHENSLRLLLAPLSNPSSQEKTNEF